MRIAQIAPLFESVPPQLYGGTERVVAYLTEELVRQGHDVTLFASADSVTSARLVPCCKRALRLDSACGDDLAPHVYMLEQVRQQSSRFDVLHFHLEYLHLPVARAQRTPHVTTMHGRLDLAELNGLYHSLADTPVVSISNAQRQPMPWANWAGTVHHGMPESAFHAGSGGDYLIFVGRISREKGVDRAVEIARRAGRRLVIAAKVALKDRDYFDSIAHLLREPFVDFIGEVSERDKRSLLGGACALVFPIDWPEPFGLVMVEAMACGTPVIAWRRGSVPEVVDEGVTGYVVDSVDEALAALACLSSFDRGGCVARARERFSQARMADDYVQIYARLTASRASHSVTSVRPARWGSRGIEGPIADVK